jgi:acyl-coenzyme A synthetase/AMP-(fatty) acid ligase
MGHRIELGEIETAVGSLDNINLCCCLYDPVGSKIILFYQGQAERGYITENLKHILPKYMMPNVFKNIDEMPLNSNGKIDRQKLKEFM